MAKGILVCGLNGAGKSTLAKELAEALHFRFVDIEDIYFLKKDNPNYPYENPRPYDEVVSSLTNIVNGETDFVLASVTGHFGNEFISNLQCAIYIEVPREVRLKRVYDRSYELFGDKALEGGDFYEQTKAFYDFCEGRDEQLVENWLANLHCPVIRIDGTLPIDTNVKLITKKLNDKYKEETVCLTQKMELFN